jgi:hypothetical protein
MLVNYSLIFISLVLFAGLAVDVGMLERGYLRLQGGAQAAVAGSVALQRGGSGATVTAAGQAAAAANGYTNGANGVTVTIENPPASGSYAGNSLALRATISRTMPSTFLAFAGLGNVNMKAQVLQVAATPITLTPAYNVNAISTDGTAIYSTGGFDNSSYAYSANALGAVRASNALGALISWRGNIFFLGPPNVKNGVANATVALSGTYSQLLMLAATAYGPQLNQSFVVTYSDSTTTTATFNMSDWCNPQNYSGETLVAQEAYRDYQSSSSSAATQDSANHTQIYGYTINLNNSKSLASLKLPAVRNVVLLGLDLKP